MVILLTSIFLNSIIASVDTDLLTVVPNERTNHVTVNCSIVGGYQFRLYFYVRNNTSHKRIGKIQLKTKNLYTNETEVWTQPEKKLKDKRMVVMFNLWQMRRPNVALDRKNRPVKYLLWAERSRAKHQMIWEYKKPFTLLEHFFGCLPRTPYKHMIKIESIEMASISISWKLHKLIREFQPKMETYVDGQHQNGMSSKECNSRCLEKIMPIDTCKQHRICIRTTFEHQHFKHILNITDYACTNSQRYNCTQKGALHPLAMKQEIVIVLTAFLVFIVVVVGWLVWQRCKQVPDYVERHKDEPIAPRDQQHVYECIDNLSDSNSTEETDKQEQYENGVNITQRAEMNNVISEEAHHFMVNTRSRNLERKSFLRSLTCCCNANIDEKSQQLSHHLFCNRIAK